MVSQLSTDISLEAPLLGIEHRSYARSDLGILFGPRDHRWGCPDSTTEVLNTETGQVRPLPCRRATCHICNRAYLRQVHRAVAVALPRWMLLITGLTGVWETDNKAISSKWIPALRRDGYEMNLVYAIEPNPRRTGFHAHGWCYGDTIPPVELQHRADVAGLGRTDMIPVRSRKNFAYPFKGCNWNAESVAEYRINNGSMRIHTTRGFWRDHRTGEQFDSMEACAAALSPSCHSDQPLLFRRIQPSDPYRSAREIRLANLASAAVASSGT